MTQYKKSDMKKIEMFLTQIQCLTKKGFVVESVTQGEDKMLVLMEKSIDVQTMPGVTTRKYETRTASLSPSSIRINGRLQSSVTFSTTYCNDRLVYIFVPAISTHPAYNSITDLPRIVIA